MIPSSTTQRPDLGAIASEVMRDAGKSGFIGFQVLPAFRSEIATGEYPIITRESMMKMPETRRAAKSGYNRGDWRFDLDNFACVEHGWEEPVDDKQAKLYARYFDAEVISTRRAMSIILRAQEKRIADAVFNTSTWTAVSITHEWDDATNAVPLSDVTTGKKAIKDATGITPNALVIAYSTFLDLGLCDDVVDRLKYVSPAVQRGEISAQMLASYFALDKVLVGDAYYDAAKAGQDASMSGIWSSEYAMLCRVATSGDLEEPALGRTFVWTEESGSGEDTTIVEEYRDEKIRGNVIRVRHDTTEKIVCTDVGYLMDNITT